MGLENISDEILLSGMKMCYENGKALLNEASILSQANKYPRAYALCQLAIEEFAKSPILFSVLVQRLEKNEIDYNNYNRMFTDHKAKTEFSIEWEIAMFKSFKQETGLDYADNLIKRSEEYLIKLREFNNMKNESIYVCIKNDEFQSPSELITKNHFDSIFGITSLREIMLQFFSKVDPTSIEQLKKNFDENS